MNKAIVLPAGLVTIAEEFKLPLWLLESKDGCARVSCEAGNTKEAIQKFNNEPLNSETRAAAWITRESLSIKAVQESEIIEDLVLIYNDSPPGGKAEKLSLKKILSLITTERESKRALELVGGGVAKVLVGVRIREKWEKISLEKLSQANSLVEIIDISQVKADTKHVEFAFKTKINRMVFKKLKEVNVSFEGMHNLLDLTLVNCDDWVCVTVVNHWILHTKTFKKKTEVFKMALNSGIPYEYLLLDCIKSAKNFKALKQLYCEISDYQGTKEAMFWKLVELADNIKDLAYLYHASASYYPVQVAVIGKIVRLYKKQPAKKSSLVKKST